jgi:hypothetical protein
MTQTIEFVRDARNSQKARTEALFSLVLAGAVDADTARTLRDEVAATKTVKRPAGEPREYGVVAYTRDLLHTDLTHRQIRDEVLAEFPAAKTTIKSVATVAKVMRKQGVKLPTRVVQY